MCQKSATIFLVDDDASVLRALKRLLKSAGFNAEAYSSAREFLDSDYAGRAGLLLLDVRMPEMSGIEVQKHVVESGSQMPVIFMTAHENEKTQKKALESGAVAFFQKPLEEDVLLEAIYTGLRQNENNDNRRTKSVNP